MSICKVTGAAAVSQVMSSKSTVVQGGALGITHNNANGSSKTEVAMMDMNGDGFPDIIAGGTIQYTNSQGGLSGEIYKGIGANFLTLTMLLRHGDMVAIQ